MAMTLRLDEEEERALLVLKELLGASTATSTIKQVILKHKDLLDKLEQLSKLFNSVTAEHHNLKQGAHALFKAQNDLSDMLYGDLWRVELEKRSHDYEMGKTEGLTREEFDKKWLESQK